MINTLINLFQSAVIVLTLILLWTVIPVIIITVVVVVVFAFVYKLVSEHNRTAYDGDQPDNE